MKSRPDCRGRWQRRILLSQRASAEIQHFIDVGEYGIALETAVGIFAVASAEMRRLVGKLAELMELDAPDVLRRLDEPA
jgi:hypothetical protein